MTCNEDLVMMQPRVVATMHLEVLLTPKDRPHLLTTRRTVPPHLLIVLGAGTRHRHEEETPSADELEVLLSVLVSFDDVGFKFQSH